MSEITAIVPQKHDPTRYNIEVDGRFYCGMSAETVVKNRLKKGMPVTADSLAAMQLESEKQTAFDKALRHISASMKTEREIRDFLRRKGYLDEVIDDVVGRMKGYGFLDDEAYAQAYAESAGKRKGGRLIAMELRRKGIGEEAVGAALEGLGDGRESARRTLEKYLRGKERDEKIFRRAYAYLIGKGYDGETVRAVLLEVLKEDGDPDGA